VGDTKELEAIRQTFGDKIPPISSSKSLAGHSLGASGVQEAIYSLLMVENSFIQASANIDNLDEAAKDMPIVTERQDNVELNTVMSNNFGFGGTNACLVFQKYRG
jgi:3-oxoacyl-[acyl-carrier-protein] synthase-1